MTFKYLDTTGLTVYDLKIKEFVSGKYATKESVPTKTSQLTNDSQYVSGGVAFSQDEKNKLSGIASGAQVNVIETINVNGKAVSPTSKAVNITIPTDNKSLVNGAGYQTSAQVESAITAKGYQTAAQVTATIEGYGYQDADAVDGLIVAKGYQTSDQVKTIVTGYGYQTAANVRTIVTGYGYQTAAQVKTAIEAYKYQTAANVESAITAKGYQTAAQVKTVIEGYGYQTEVQVNGLIAKAGHLTRKVAETLPTTGEDNVIYLVPASHSVSGNIKDEYMWIDSKWEKVGSNETSLDGYVKETDLVAITEDEINALFAA